MDPDDLKKLTNIGPATDKVLKAAGIETYDQIVKMTPEQLDKVLEAGGTNKLGEKWNKAIEDAKPLAEVAASNASNPFRKVPELFELPAVDSTESKKLTELLIPANYLLTTELVSPDGVSPRRIFFELNKSSSNDQSWTVAVKKNKSASSSTDIATFTKTVDAFNFAWLPAAASDKTAVYLRNCLLRLSTPDGRSSVSKLRKPFLVRPLRINKDKLSDSVKIEIEGAPDFDRIQIQLGAMSYRRRTVDVIDPSCSLDSPAVIALKRRERSGQFMVLQVSVERSGGGVKLSAGLLLNGTPIKSSKQLLTIQKRLAAEVAMAEQRPDLTAAERKKMVSATTGNRNRMNDYMKSIEWLSEGGGGIGHAIGFDIAAEFEDGRLILVKTDNNMVDNKKKKK